MQVDKHHLLENGNDGHQLDATIELLKHTSQLIKFFSTSKQAIRSIDDGRRKKLDDFLLFLTKWKEEVTIPCEFISSKLWFDLQSMIHGFKSLVNIKLSNFPNSAVKAWVINQDVIENHFCQVRACNGLDPVVQRGDNFIPGINNAIPRIKFIPGLNCVARSGDKFIFGINRVNSGIKLTQRLSRVKSLSRCFFVMKHYRKQFCRYICFSNNIPEQHCRGRIWKENQNGRIIIFDIKYEFHSEVSHNQKQ